MKTTEFNESFIRAYLHSVAEADEATVREYVYSKEDNNYSGRYYTSLTDAYLMFQAGAAFAKGDKK